MEQAKKILRTNSDSLIDIALDCGFSSHAHFSNTFRQIVGVTPSEYRGAVIVPICKKGSFSQATPLGVHYSLSEGCTNVQVANTRRVVPMNPWSTVGAVTTGPISARRTFRTLMNRSRRVTTVRIGCIPQCHGDLGASRKRVQSGVSAGANLHAGRHRVYGCLIRRSPMAHRRDHLRQRRSSLT